MHNKYYILFILSFFAISNLAYAHSEHDKTRFVDSKGKDTGRCDNVLRPCKTIAYAVQQANKGDKILVASGEYQISSSDELFYLKSALVPVLGGYNRFDHFQSQSPDTNLTTLTNIPVEMAPELRKQGFSVIADGKAISDNKALKEKLSNYYSLNQQQAALSCQNGKADDFDCENIDLLSHVPLANFSSQPGSANDIWGHVDLNNGKEYALIGLQNGIAVFDVTNPNEPIEVGTVSGKNSGWRDIKIYQYYDDTFKIWRAYAYATVDRSIDYVTIIDLNNLPRTVSLANKSQVVSTAHNIYISNVDHTLNIALPDMTPTLQLVGANTFSGAFHSYSLQNPQDITLISQQSVGQGYSHDGATIVIDDERKNADCNNNGQRCTVFIDFNEKEMKLWNISNAGNIEQLGTGTYNDVSSSNQYVHSGWGSEDKQYIFLHDEFDEKNGGLNSTVRVFSIADLNNPQHVGQWTGTTRAIDHNGYTRGNRYYMSNYEHGLTVLDITNPLLPRTIGSFDTYTPSNNANYNGAWGAYPFLPSGNILISDINSGLYILKDNTLASENGTLSFPNKAITAPQGKNVMIEVQRISNSVGEVSIDYEMIPGSAKEIEDYTATKGTLTWASNDNTNKVITIPIAEDSTGNELEESFFIRLYNPQGGATLSSPSYLTVNIEGQPNTGIIGFTQSSITVPENSQSVDISVNRRGSTMGTSTVNYQIESVSAMLDEDVMQSNGTLTWQDGESDRKTITLNIIDDEITEESETFTLTLEAVDDSRLNAINQMTITISDDDSNTAPIITAIEDFQANTSQTVSLSANVTDAESDPLTYLWQQTSGNAVELSSTDELATSFIAPSTAGEVTFSLTVTDSKLATATEFVTVTVIAPPVVSKTGSSSSGGGSFYHFLLFVCFIAGVRKLTK